MTQTTATPPPIYAPLGKGRGVSMANRIVLGALSVGCLTVLILAYRLHPDPSGMGTHTNLGLARCPFLYYSGLPCPSCGMTTSFSWMAHGNPLASIWVQPMGALLAFLAACTFWIAGYVALTGRRFDRLARMVPMTAILPSLFFFGILAWGWKIFIHLRHIDGWR